MFNFYFTIAMILFIAQGFCVAVEHIHLTLEDFYSMLGASVLWPVLAMFAFLGLVDSLMMSLDRYNKEKEDVEHNRQSDWNNCNDYSGHFHSDILNGFYNIYDVEKIL